MLAFNGLSSTGASDIPVEVKVDDHEQRITRSEQDIAETKDRVSQVEEKADTNTEAIREVERQIVVVQEKADTTAGQVQQLQEQAAAPTPAPVAQAEPEPTPAPAPTPSKRLIVELEDRGPNYDKFGNYLNRTCIYKVYAGKTITARQLEPCSPVGTLISSDLSAMNGLGYE
ncbi:hypothetical protein G3I13_01875 [Streptomyces sp. SID6673]|nr:hypothetical protein [Streptomyces sp. SID11726]NDZ94909.1 hypothetical protein [Streptomyces sp. SID11726]NEB23069.1 hypothetical protein [Streptomyces sp. SID6673]